MKIKLLLPGLIIVILIASACTRGREVPPSAPYPTDTILPPPSVKVTTQTPSFQATSTSSATASATVPTCPSAPITIHYDNGLSWTKVQIPDKRYFWTVVDVGLLKSCIDFPEMDDHDQAILGKRIGSSAIADLEITIGSDLYQTKSDETSGCCDYDLLKNGTVILQTSAPLITTNPNRTIWNIGGVLVWELLKDPPTIFVDGVDQNEKFGWDGSYYPYAINGKLIYFAQKGLVYQVIYDNQPVGPEFSEISLSYCCAGMPIHRGGGKYMFIGKHDGEMFLVMIQFFPQS